jgi:hypothetical protein
MMCNAQMDISEVRRVALRRLIANRYEGVSRHLALASGKPERQINDMLSSPPRKSFGEKVARNLEQSLGLPPLFLDRIEEPANDYREADDTARSRYRVAAAQEGSRFELQDTPRVYSLTPDEQELLDGYRLADDSLKRTMLVLARDATGRFGRRRANHQ